MKRFSVPTILVAQLVFASAAQAQVSFFQPPTFTGNGTVFVADFNGDGKPDVLTSDGTMNLGNGDGTFKQGTSLSNTSVPILAVADFNGDGKPDVLEQGTGTLLVLLGNGDGTFQAPVSTASGANLSPVAAVDLNGDQKADVVGIFNSSVYVYISNGDGTFKAGVPYSLGSSINSYYMVLSFGDFNGDGKIDVAVSIAGSTAPGQEIVFLGNGDGTLQSPKTSSGVNDTQYVVVGDFNGDGKPDLAISTSSFPSPTAVYVLLGNGDGTFQTPTVEINVSGPLGVADLNGDGKLDLVLGSPGVAQVYLGNGDGTFTNTTNYQLCLPEDALVGPPAAGVIAADINSDGKADIIGCNAVLLGNGNGTFQGWPLAVGPNLRPDAAVIGRFDKTGAPGVAVTSGGNIYVLNNDGTGALSLSHTYALQQPGVGIATADFNGDGNLDLVVIGNYESNWSLSVLLGNGDGSFQTPVFYPQSSTLNSLYVFSVVVADFNNDHKPDLAVGGLSNQSLAILLGNGDGTFAAPVLYFDNGFGPLLVADFNDDGKLDIAAGGTDLPQNTLATTILFGNGDGTFQAAVFPSSLNNFYATLTADVRNIGKADLIASTGGSSQIALGNGDGTFSLLPALTCPSWSGMPCFIVAVADLNNDGKTDIFIQQGGLQIFQTGIQLGNGDGTFGPAMQVPTNNGYVPLLSIADMNGDGKPDLIFMWPPGLGGALNGVGVILNMSTPDFTINSASGSPTSQTINAGQSANFQLAIGPAGPFSGTVNLTCVVTPVVTPAPTCSLSSSSVQISGNGTQTVTMTVGTTATVTSGVGPSIVWPPFAIFSMFVLCGLGYLLTPTRKQLRVLAAPATIALALCMSCGGSSSYSHHTTGGTPSGTYSATITASSGSLTHSMPLQVIVQ